MNIILLTDAITPPLTGIGRYTLELARGLPVHRSVHEIRYLHHARWQGDPEEKLNVAAAGSPITARRPSLLPIHRYLSRQPWATRLFATLVPAFQAYRLRHSGDAILHGPNFTLPPFDGRSIATFHDMSIFRYPQYHPKARIDWMNKLIPATLRRASRLITDSDYVREEIHQHFGYPLDRIHTVPLAISPEFHPRASSETTPTLAKYHLTHGAYLLSVATLEPRKNLDGLLTAYEQLPSSLRQRYPLVICGAHGWSNQPLLERIERAKRAGWLIHPGYLPEHHLPLLMAGAAGLAFLSHYEGFGLPVLEALASGIPVLSSNRSSLPEVGGEVARYVDPDDQEAVVTALRQLLEDQNCRAGIRTSGPAHAAAFTWQRTVDQTIDVYRRAIDGR